MLKLQLLGWMDMYLRSPGRVSVTVTPVAGTGPLFSTVTV
jgi:hypothetical protein